MDVAAQSSSIMYIVSAAWMWPATPDYWAAGPGCGLPCGGKARPKEQALAFADLARGLEAAVGVAHMRSALGLSSIYRQQKGWLPLLRKTSAAALA
jgi:hypothetical protein